MPRRASGCHLVAFKSTFSQHHASVVAEPFRHDNAASIPQAPWREEGAEPMHPPQHPIDAVTHLDPYDYYATLVEQCPFEREATLGLFVAANAETVAAVLTSDRCRVRPADEPVP